jgi:hypothetical protein
MAGPVSHLCHMEDTGDDASSGDFMQFTQVIRQLCSVRGPFDPGIVIDIVGANLGVRPVMPPAPVKLRTSGGATPV